MNNYGDVFIVNINALPSVNIFFFFFKQKTAYEMRISDWSSDVCSSDLALIAVLRGRGFVNFTLEWFWEKANAGLSLLGLGSYQLLGERFVPLELLYNNTAVVIGLVYVHLPFMVLPLYASLEKLDRSLIEAAPDPIGRAPGGGRVGPY